MDYLIREPRPEGAAKEFYTLVINKCGKSIIQLEQAQQDNQVV